MQMRIIFPRIKTTTKLDWDGPCKVPFRLYLTTQITTTAKHRDFFRFKPKKSTFFKGGECSYMIMSFSIYFRICSENLFSAVKLKNCNICKLKLL